MVVSLRTSLVAVACAWAACDPSTEAPRVPTERGSLGHELYGVLCDRVGAQSLREDVTGASYQRLCHPPAKTEAPSSVDRERLPPLTEGARNGEGEVVPVRQQRGGREHGIARVEVLAEQRDALAAAFDAMLPDVTLPSADCPGANAEVPLHTALREALSELVPLYDDQTVPRVSRALGALLEEVATDTAVQRSLSRLDARKGYQPQELSLYVEIVTSNGGWGMARGSGSRPDVPMSLPASRRGQTQKQQPPRAGPAGHAQLPGPGLHARQGRQTRRPRPGPRCTVRVKTELSGRAHPEAMVGG